MASNPVSLSARAGKEVPTQHGADWSPTSGAQKPAKSPAQLEDLGRTAHEQEAKEVEAEVVVTEEESDTPINRPQESRSPRVFASVTERSLQQRGKNAFFFTPHVT